MSAAYSRAVAPRGDIGRGLELLADRLGVIAQSLRCAGARRIATDEDVINWAYQTLHDRVDQVEYLIGYEGNAFAFTGDAEEDLLSITAVHPMREEAVSEFLARAGSDWSVVQQLIDGAQLVETEFAGRHFYVRRLH